MIARGLSKYLKFEIIWISARLTSSNAQLGESHNFARSLRCMLENAAMFMPTNSHRSFGLWECALVDFLCRPLSSLYLLCWGGFYCWKERSLHSILSWLLQAELNRRRLTLFPLGFWSKHISPVTLQSWIYPNSSDNTEIQLFDDYRFALNYTLRDNDDIPQ